MNAASVLCMFLSPQSSKSLKANGVGRKVWNGSQEDANRQTRTCAARHVAFRDKEQPRLLALTDSSFIDVFSIPSESDNQ